MTKTIEKPRFATSIKDAFVDLYFRWQDEKEYEDFSEYKAVVKKWCDEFKDHGGVTFVKMTSRPFALTFKTPTPATLCLKVASGFITLTEVK